MSHTFAMHANAFCLQQRISSFLFVSVKEIEIKLMRSANILLIITQSDQHCTHFRFYFWVLLDCINNAWRCAEIVTLTFQTNREVCFSLIWLSKFSIFWETKSCLMALVSFNGYLKLDFKNCILCWLHSIIKY